jgi:hypothetical protein
MPSRRDLGHTDRPPGRGPPDTRPNQNDRRPPGDSNERKNYPGDNRDSSRRRYSPPNDRGRYDVNDRRGHDQQQKQGIKMTLKDRVGCCHRNLS